MRFAFCVEDETDEAILAVILGKLLGTAIEADETTYQFARGGWSQALNLAPLVARRAAQANLDGALFAIDNDGWIEHDSAHSNDARCRFCLLRQAANVAAPLAWNRGTTLPELRYFFAVPVQMIETWLLQIKGHPFPGSPDSIGVDPAGRRMLKRWLYGQDGPPRDRMLEIALPLARQLNPENLAKASPSFAHLLSQT